MSFAVNKAYNKFEKALDKAVVMIYNIIRQIIKAVQHAHKKRYPRSCNFGGIIMLCRHLLFLSTVQPFADMAICKI